MKLSGKNIGDMSHFGAVMPIVLSKMASLHKSRSYRGAGARYPVVIRIIGKIFKGIIHMPEDIAPDIAFY